MTCAAPPARARAAFSAELTVAITLAPARWRAVPRSGLPLRRRRSPGSGLGPQGPGRRRKSSRSEPSCGRSASRRSSKRPRAAETSGSFTPRYEIGGGGLKPDRRGNREPRAVGDRQRLSSKARLGMSPIAACLDHEARSGRSFDVGLIHFSETAYFRQPLHGQVPKMTYYGGVAVRCENWKVARSFLYRRLASQPARLRRAKEGI